MKKKKITNVGCWCLCCCYNEEKEDHQRGLLVLALLLQLRNKRSPKWVVGACIVATTKKKKIITKVGCWCLHCCYNEEKEDHHIAHILWLGSEVGSRRR
jgi:hypothetical protein